LMSPSTVPHMIRAALPASTIEMFASASASFWFQPWPAGVTYTRSVWAASSSISALGIAITMERLCTVDEEPIAVEFCDRMTSCMLREAWTSNGPVVGATSKSADRAMLSSLSQTAFGKVMSMDSANVCTISIAIAQPVAAPLGRESPSIFLGCYGRQGDAGRRSMRVQRRRVCD